MKIEVFRRPKATLTKSLYHTLRFFAIGIGDFSDSIAEFYIGVRQITQRAHTALKTESEEPSLAEQAGFPQKTHRGERHPTARRLWAAKRPLFRFFLRFNGDTAAHTQMTGHRKSPHTVGALKITLLPSLLPLLFLLPCLQGCLLSASEYQAPSPRPLLPLSLPLLSSLSVSPRWPSASPCPQGRS